jgi:hypothetical protein
MKRNPEIAASIDERLEKAVDRANYQITLNNQKQNARYKLEADLTYATAGGIFKITPELISFVQALLTREQSSAVLLDVNRNPIYIENLQLFQDDVLSKYFEIANEFLIEFKRIEKARKPETLVS